LRHREFGYKRIGVSDLPSYLLRSEKDSLAGTGFDVNADHRFFEMAGNVETRVAQLQRVLVFILGPKTAMAFEAGGMVRALFLPLGCVNFRVDFKQAHTSSPAELGAIVMPRRTPEIL
jgi:hypothetical protein